MEDAENSSDTFSNHKFATPSDGRTNFRHHRLGFKKGMEIAPLNVNDIK